MDASYEQAKHALEEAVRLAEHGYYLTPVTLTRKSNGKKAAQFHRPSWRSEGDYSCDPDQIRAWWVDHPDTSFALVCGPSGVEGVDLDVKKDEVDAVTWWAQNSYPVSSLMVDTQSGGLHLIWRRRTDGKTLPNRAGQIMRGVDTRNHNGVFFAAGSYVAGESGCYTINGALPRVEELDETPDEVLNLFPPTKSDNERQSGKVTYHTTEWMHDKWHEQLGLVEHHKSGSGGFRYLLMGAAMVGGRLVEASIIDHDSAVQALRKACIVVFGSPDAEDEQWIQDGLRDGPRKEQWRVSEGVTVLRDPAQPDFWETRPVLGHIRDFARARRVGPWAVLGITLARIIAMIPPFVVLPPLVGGHASLNLFVGVVGTSGDGKGGAEAAADDIINSSETIQKLTVGSGEAIAHAFMHRRQNEQTKVWEVHQHTERVLFSVSEIDTLGALHSRTAATIMPELRKAWMGEQLGFHYVDPLKRLPVPRHKYRLCMVVGIQPNRAGTLLDDADGGTPQRFVWLPVGDPDVPEVAPTLPSAWPWRLPRPWLATAGGHAELAVCETARQMVDQARVARLRGDADALNGHALLARLKVAAALGLLDQRQEVAEEDWELAGTVMAISDRTREAVLDSLKKAGREVNAAKGQAEAQRAVLVDAARDQVAVNRVKRKLLNHLRKVEWQSCGRLRNWLSSRDREYFEDAIDRLVQESYVDLDETLQGVGYRVKG